jgi:acyl-CoA synthetase (AMP-forming)/AMP-acid ligase II
VERVLLEHPAVGDVAVVGVSQSAGIGTAHGLDVGVAFVVLATGHDATAEEITDFAHARLDGHEVPVAVVFLESLPRNTVGKLQRERLRAQWSQPGADRDR